MAVRTITAGVLFVTLSTALAQPPKAAEPAPLPAPPRPKMAEKVDLNRRLAARVALDKYEGKFCDAVAVVRATCDVPLVATRQALRNLILNDEGEQVPRGELMVQLPQLDSVKAETVLTLLCEQAGARFLVHPDHIRIVPDAFAAYESGVLAVPTDLGAEDEPLLAAADLLLARPLIKRGLVNAAFKNQPLSEIIDAIADATGATVTVSPTLPAALRQTPVTVRFANTPVDAAVRTLCEMADAGAIEDANTLLVTTRERAAARAKEEAQKRNDKQPAPPGFYGINPGGFPGPVTADRAEIARLKERNEALAKQLEVLAKQVDELKAKKP